MQVPLRRILPASDGPITIAEAYAAPLGGHGDRPWVGLCMVASIDGSTVVDGVSAGLSSDNDSEVLQQLRSVAEVIIVGAGTVRGEGYGKPKKDGQRIGVVTRSGSVDTTSDLFRSGAGFVITTEHAEIDDSHVDVLRAGRDEVDLRSAIEQLPALCPGVEFVQAEGGATPQRCARRRRRVRRAERHDVTGHGRRGRPSSLPRRRRSFPPLRPGAARRRRRVVPVQPLASARGADFSMSSSSRWKSAAASKCL